MAPEDDDRPGSVLVYQVQQIKEQYQQLEKQIGIGLRHVDEQLERLATEMRSSIAALTFVSEKAYLADRSADQRIQAVRDLSVDKEMKDIRSIAENARATAWTVAVFVIGSIAAILAIIKAVAG